MKKRSPAKIAIVTIAIILVCLAGAITTLYIMFPQEKIVALVIPQADKSLGRKITFEKTGISIFPQIGFTISGLQIANTEREGFSREPFVKVEKFTAGVSVASIFKGYPEITTILLRKPQFLVEVDKNGAFNFDDLAILSKDTTKNKKIELPFPLTVKNLAIEKGSIAYKDAKAGNQVIIGSVNEQMNVSMDKDLRDIKTTGHLVLGNVSIATALLKKRLDNLTVTFSHDIDVNLADSSGSVKINMVRLSLQKVYISLKGTVEKILLPTPVLNLALVSDRISVADLLKEIPANLVPGIENVSAGGTAEIGMKFNGALETGKPLPLLGKLVLRDVMIQKAGMPESIHNFNSNMSFTDNSLTINSLKLLFGTSPIEMQGTINNFAKPYVDIKALADIKLNDVKNVVKLPSGSAVNGEIKLNVAARGEADPANPSKLDCKGTAYLQNVVVLWPPIVKPATINGTLSLSSKSVDENIGIILGTSSFSTKGSVSNYLSLILPAVAPNKNPRPVFNFTLSSPLLNADELMKPTAPSNAKEKPDPAKANGTKKSDEALFSQLPEIDLQGTITAQKVVYQSSTMSNVTAKISLIHDISDINYSSGFAGGSIGFNLHANLKNSRNIVFTNNLNIKSIEVSDLLKQFGSYIKPVTPFNKELVQLNKCLFGRINLQSSLAGSGGTAEAITKSLTGTIGIQMTDGKIVNAPVTRVALSSFAKFLKTDKLGNFDVINIHDLSTKIRVVNGNVLFDDLKIQSDVMDWAAKGDVGLDARMNMAASAKLSRELSGKLLAIEGTAKNVAKGMLDKTKFAAASGLLDNANLIPRDNENRVTLKFGLGGLVSNPTISSLAFGAGATGKNAQQQTTLKQQVQEKVQQQVNQVVEQKKVEAKVEIKKVETTVKQKVQDKIKGIFR